LSVLLPHNITAIGIHFGRVSLDQPIFGSLITECTEIACCCPILPKTHDMSTYCHSGPQYVTEICSAVSNLFCEDGWTDRCGKVRYVCVAFMSG
jgi:hypothetical protein